MSVRSVNDLSRYPQIPAQLLSRARVLADRGAALDLWPRGAVIAEVGVGFGVFSRTILDVCQPKKFIAIDRFDLHEIPELWGQRTEEVFGGRPHDADYRHRFSREIDAGRLEVMKGDSAASIAALPDESVDLFYIDADHLYEGVRRDLHTLAPKVKRDGWIVMNDYIPADTFSGAPLGVIQATNEFMVEHGWEMAYLALSPIMYCDVAMRRVGAARGPTPDQLTAALDAAERRAEALEAALVATRASTCWRVTAPLRRLKLAMTAYSAAPRSRIAKNSAVPYTVG